MVENENNFVCPHALIEYPFLIQCSSHCLCLNVCKIEFLKKNALLSMIQTKAIQVNRQLSFERLSPKLRAQCPFDTFR